MTLLTRREALSRMAAGLAGLGLTISGAAKAQQAGVDPANILFWKGEDQLFAYRNMDRLFPTRTIRRGPRSTPWISAPAEPDIQYLYQGETWDIARLMTYNRIGGLMVVRDREVAIERYGLGNDANTLWTSFSIAKSLTSTLIGAAIHDGHIRGVDEHVTRYLPMLRGSGFDGCTIRDLLRMSSGVKWNEDYLDPASDVNHMNSLVARRSREDRLLPFLAGLQRADSPGKVFQYKTGETAILAYLARAAIGRPLAEYASERIWKPCGFERDGYWVLANEGGVEWGGACFSATLRDYARFGQFMLDNGRAGDRQILPEWWMWEASQASAPASATGPSGYGYQWWIGLGAGFRARGVFGQQIYINPAERLVIAVHSAWAGPRPEENFAAFDAFISAINGWGNELG